MCGIAGLINCGDRAVLERMTEVISHRGPDDWGVEWFEKSCSGLGNRRLSVIDLSSAGHQPMANVRGNLWITYNGEVYNFKEIRRLLTDKTFRFRSGSDTEVILYAYELWGNKALARFNGMFAFAIFDQESETLFAARDRLGVKPFYFAEVGKGLIFSSEIKSIVASGLISTTIDQQALEMYLSLQYVPGPRTLFKGIFKLMPGDYLLYGKTGLSTGEYWRAPYQNEYDDKGLPTHIEEFRDLLRDAVHLRMISDVPVGAFLSGGIDSSIIVSEMSKLSTEKVRTYSVGFLDGGKRYDELRYARSVSDHCRTEHQNVICTSDEAGLEMPRLLYYLDEPVGEDLIYPYNKLSRIARKDVTVVLTGEGADEFLHGYRYYSVLDRYGAAFSKIPKQFRGLLLLLLKRVDTVDDVKMRMLLALLRNGSFEMACQSGFVIPPWEVERLVSNNTQLSIEEFLYESVPTKLNGNLVRSFLDYKYRLVDYILMRSDKMSMEAGLECRCPFLDYRVVEYMVQLPIHYKNPNGLSKFLLRQAYKDDIPKVIIERDKRSFAAPIRAWLHGLAERYLFDSTLVEDQIITQRGLDRYLVFDAARRARSPNKLLIILALELWYRAYFRNAVFREI